MSHPILIVDDEPSICWAVSKALRGEGHRTLIASSAEEGLDLAAEHSLAMTILDVRLPGVGGIESLPKFARATGGAPVVVITAFGDLETAVAAVKSGASDYLTKPFKLDDILRVCERALHSAAVEKRSPPRDADAVSPSLVGRSPAMQQVFKQIALVADSDLPVLITGETGTGKELVASAIAQHSSRSEQPYLAVAPVALHPELVESELFGHAKGSFTGATADRAGLFERAAGGTLLLDEIGDLPANVQVKLLRVLEQGVFTRVGDLQPRQADVRVLAATNSDLSADVADGSFRADLFHRLNGMRIHLPPLRERPEDIELLCHHFLRTMRSPSHVPDLPSSLVEQLRTRPWYGNVRELRNATRHAAVVARGRKLTIEDFPAPQAGRGEATTAESCPLGDVVSAWTIRQLQSSETEARSSFHTEFLAAVEPSFLRTVLEHTSGNRAKAAELLGIHRGTLRERIRAYNLDR